MLRRLLTPLAALLLCASLAQAEPVKLSYSNFFPPTHVQSKLAEEWAKEVEKRTNGAVVIEYYPGGTLTKANQTYGAVEEGVADIGMSALAYSRGRFPLMAAVDLPLGYVSGVQATAVANDVYAKFRPKALDGAHVLYFHAHGPGYLHTKGKPVKTMEDVKGLKLRATGNSAKVVEALGGVPVAQSMPDAYQAIQKGVVDGGMYPLETNKGWKMAEVVDYATLARATAYTTTFFVVINKDKWAAIPPEAQAAITELCAEWSVKHGEAWDASDAEGLEFFISDNGQTFTLDPAEEARWAAAVAPVVDEYEAEVAQKGVDGKAVVEFIRAELAKAE